MAKRLIWILLAVMALPILLEVAGRCLWYQSPNGSTSALSVGLRDFRTRRSLPAVQTTRPATEPDELAHFLGTPDEIQRLATAFQAQHITLHNTPYAELKQPAGSAHFIDPEFTKLPQGRSYSQYLDADGHLCNLPKAAYDMYYLRSRIFNRHDPVVLEARAGDVQTEDVLAFRARYALEPKRATIDENGDRITLPASAASNLILVVGDSMAFGYGVGDEETLPWTFTKWWMITGNAKAPRLPA
jgi:hypothetical protein